MTTVSFPPHLPFIPIDGGIDATLQDNRLATPQDYGVPSYRRRFTGQFEPLTFECLYTRSEWNDLLDFYETDCGGGAYMMRAPDLDNRNVTSEYSWAAPPSRRAHVPNMSKWRVTFSLVRRVR